MKTRLDVSGLDVSHNAIIYKLMCSNINSISKIKFKNVVESISGADIKVNLNTSLKYESGWNHAIMSYINDSTRTNIPSPWPSWLSFRKKSQNAYFAKSGPDKTIARLSLLPSLR